MSKDIATPPAPVTEPPPSAGGLSGALRDAIAAWAFDAKIKDGIISPFSVVELRDSILTLLAALRPAQQPVEGEREAIEADAQAKAQEIYIAATEENKALRERLAMLTKQSDDEQYLQEVADGAWGDDPRMRGLARDQLIALRSRS